VPVAEGKMTVELYPDFFNDVFGPSMQPGSSSHTAGPCRLGYLANNLLGESPADVQVVLDRRGSFAGTFGLMHEDSGMLAGAMGLLPDDPRLFDARDLARQAGVTFSFEFSELEESRHANAVKFVLTDRAGRCAALVGESTGGGMVRTRMIDGYPLQVAGDTFALLLYDPQASLTPQQIEIVANRIPAPVAQDESSVPGRGRLLYFKCAAEPDLAAIRRITPGLKIRLLRPVLPVISRPERKPQLFDTMTRWRELARERGLPLWEVALQYEMDASGWTRDEVVNEMRQVARRMHRQTRAAYDEEWSVPEHPFRPNLAARWSRHMDSPRRLTGEMMARAIKGAYGAGAGIPGVETVAGPMGSGGGYIYAVLDAVRQIKGFSAEDLLRGLFVAAAVGAIAFSRTEPTGEVIGCTGECGVMGAMAAAGITEMAGGTPGQVENAASFSLQSSIGIPCDPIPGGLSQPCRSRVIAATCTAPVFSDLALAGLEAVLPLHEVIDVADAVGRQLPPDLLCTSRGGACATPTARARASAFREWFEQAQGESLPRPPGNLI
jgi:L-serine dehydratase